MENIHWTVVTLRQCVDIQTTSGIYNCSNSSTQKVKWHLNKYIYIHANTHTHTHTNTHTQRASRAQNIFADSSEVSKVWTVKNHIRLVPEFNKLLNRKGPKAYTVKLWATSHVLTLDKHFLTTRFNGALRPTKMRLLASIHTVDVTPSRVLGLPIYSAWHPTRGSSGTPLWEPQISQCTVHTFLKGNAQYNKSINVWQIIEFALPKCVQW